MHFKTLIIKFFYNKLGILAMIIYFYCMLKVRKKTAKIFIFIIIQGTYGTITYITIYPHNVIKT